MKIDLSKVCDIEFNDIYHDDYPDFSDAYISAASLDLGEGKFRDLTEDECYKLQDENPDWFYEKLMNHIY